MLTNKNKWCYSIGGLRDCMYAFFTMYIMAYIQFTINVTPAQYAIITVIMIACRVWDAINDPMMATILENSKLKGGKYKPWIALGAVTNGIVTILIFTVRLEGWGFVALFGLLYLLWGMTYTMNDIGYWSMLPVLSDNEKDRTKLMTLMQILSSVGSFVTAGLVPMFTNGNAVQAYAIISIIVSLAFVGVQVVTILGVTEPPRMPPREEDKISLKKMVSIIRKNDQLLWVTVVMFFYYWGSGLLLMFGPNFCNFEFGYSQGGGILTLFTVVYAVGTLAGQFSFGFLSKKFTKKKIQTIGIISLTIGYVLLFGFRYILPANFVSIAIAGFLIFFGQIVFYLALLVQMTNTVEYNEYISGSKNEAVVSSLRSLLAKLTGALQQGILSLVLLMSGLIVLSNNISELENQINKGLITSEYFAVQSDLITASATGQMLLILRIGMVVVPAVLIVIAYFIVNKKYTITEEKYAEICDELKARETKI